MDEYTEGQTVSVSAVTESCLPAHHATRYTVGAPKGGKEYFYPPAVPSATSASRTAAAGRREFATLGHRFDENGLMAWFCTPSSLVQGLVLASRLRTHILWTH